MWFGKFDFAGYTYACFAETKSRLDRSLQLEYYRCTAVWKTNEDVTWKEYKEYSGVVYKKITAGKVYEI